MSGRICQDNRIWCEQMPCPVHWWPSRRSNTIGVVVLVHGFALHARAFDAVASYLSDRGYAAVAIDMRGFGERQPFSNCDLGDLEGMARSSTIIDYHKSLSDFELLIHLIRSKYSDVPVFLLGESLGASMVIHLAADHSQIEGIILSNPALRLKETVVTECLVGAISVSGFPHWIMNLSRCIPRVVADDPQVRSEAANDPFIRARYSLCDLWKTLSFMQQTMALCPRIPAKVPAFVMETSNETLLSERPAYKMYRRLGSDDKTLRVFRDKAHLLLETRYVHPDVLAAVYHWLNERVAESTRTARQMDNRRPAAKQANSQSSRGVT